MYPDLHRAVFPGFGQQAQVGCQDIPPDGCIGIVAIRAGVVPLLILIVRPIVIIIIIVIASLVEELEVFPELHLILRLDLRLTLLLYLRTSVCRQIPIVGKDDAIDSSRLRLHQLAKVDAVCLPACQIILRVIEEDGFACHQPTDAHQVAAPIQLIRL